MKITIALLALSLSSCCLGKNIDVNPRVVGGDFAEKNQFPHQIAIFYRGSLRCGGSIISPVWVVTAAHCVEQGSGTVQGLSILAGTNSLSKGGERRNVVKSIYHENFGNFKNDIALMRLDKPLNFSAAIQAIELVEEEVPEGSDIVIAGWGKQSNWQGVSERLKFNTLKAVGHKECAATGIDYEGLICLGHAINNGACNGDSGGSAMYNKKLVGVANFVVFGCGSENPDGYAKVSFFVNWIKNTIANYESRLKPSKLILI